MKILVNIISHVNSRDYSELLEDLKEYDVEVVETIKQYDPSLTHQGYQLNVDKERFLTQHDEDFLITLRGTSKLSRDFKTLVEAVSKEDIDLVFQAGKRELYVGDTLYETDEGFLREVLERYCELGMNTSFKHPVEYIQNLMMSVAPYAPLYVPYTNEQGAFNNLLGYSRKFAELFTFNEAINPCDIITNHDALMTASRNDLEVRYLQSNTFVEEHMDINEICQGGMWENYTEEWRTAMKRAIPKFTKNITNRKIKFI